ncbi:MAG: PIG-L deacetylase family protein, partial [Hyphomicrobiaceae bacterium]
MKALRLADKPGPIEVLCLGAHSDDIEIGAGATLLGWIDEGQLLSVTWVVLSAVGVRATEARQSAEAFLAGAARSKIELGAFRDGHFPSQTTAITEWLEDIRSRVRPDVILTHHRDDAHQDHRVVSEVTQNTFRDH